jgi:thioredoxin-like negative regulator of GroEL
MAEKENQILLFVSKISIYYSTTVEDFQKLLNSLGKVGEKFHVEIINVDEKPDVAEEYNILALPTLVIGNQHFVGQINEEKITDLIKDKIETLG